MDIKSAAFVAIGLIVFHLATIIFIRVTSGNIFRANGELGEQMSALKALRPVAYRVYQASLILPVLEFVAVAMIRLAAYAPT